MKRGPRYWVALRLEMTSRGDEVTLKRQEVARGADQATLRRAVEAREYGTGDFVLEERGDGFTHSRVELHVEPLAAVSESVVDAFRRDAIKRVEDAKQVPVEDLFLPPPRVVPTVVGAPAFALVDAIAAIAIAPEPRPTPAVVAPASPASAETVFPLDYARLVEEVRAAFTLYDEALQRLASQEVPADYAARLGEAITLAARSLEVVPQDAPAPPPALVPARAEPDRADVEVPRLQRRLGPRRPIVIVGGTPIPEMIKRVGKWLGMTPEWITCDKGQDRTTMPLATRINQGSVAAVLIVEQLLSHTNANRIKLAALASATPYAYVNKGGVESIRRGLRTIEAALEKRAS